MRTKQEARKQAEEIVSDWAAGAVLTGWIPGSALFLAGADMIMTRKVADAFGVGTFDEDALAAVIGGALSGGFAGAVIGEGVGWIPFVGWAVKSAMMGAKAKLLGNTVIDYFYGLSPLPDAGTIAAAAS
ncbi:MAG TPA: hypothetical protein VF541_05465 [Longimicrobium sp.]